MGFNGMWKFLAAGLVMLLVVVAGFSLIEGNGSDINAQAEFIAPSTDLSGYSRAVESYDWAFPRDHGSHDTFQTEWWYFTGNLKTPEGRHFGYQFTVFRRAISPQDTNTVVSSDWRTGQIYMAHFTLSDIQAQQFYHEERYSRGGAGLAGAFPNDATPDTPFRVFVENWTVEASGADTFRIDAESINGFGVDFALTQMKPPALQGDNGLSPKSAEVGNASYYYSLSRLAMEGTITVNGETFEVTGNSWMDHEFSTSALGGNALGWDWFGLHFDDGRDLMVGQIRLIGGGREPAFGGLMIEADGTTRYLNADDFEITATGEWTSPHTGAVYPSGWTIRVEDLQFTVTPLQKDQELHSGTIAYWEGAVALSGEVTGYGYAELTGYASTMTGRF
jgi:predicted secreted hydrolase